MKNTVMKIEDYINKFLTCEAKITALDFVSFLRENDIEFYKDNGACWKGKIYYHLKFNGEFVGFIAVKDPDEPENLLTVWSDNCKAFESGNIDDKIKETAYKHIDFCSKCGSCGGGRKKIVFGKEFNGVCGCTFRTDNPNKEDLLFLKKMIELHKEYIVSNDVIRHCNSLIDEGNDPVLDPKPLQDYMDKWDGQSFIDKMELNRNKSVLEIGVGTGRLAVRTAPCCDRFYGIDISAKTIERAKENLKKYSNATLLCGDFLTYIFESKFDVIYSSLTFMHIKDKQNAVNKVSSLLNPDGIFVLSIEKNQSEYIDFGTRKIPVYPDTPDSIKTYIKNANLNLTEQYETEYAHIFVARAKSHRL